MFKKITQMKSAFMVAIMLVAGLGNAWGDTTLSTGGKVTGTADTNYKIVGNDIWVIDNGVKISGQIPGYIILKNTTEAGSGTELTVSLDNVQTGSSTDTSTGWQSSLVVLNLGANNASDGYAEVKIIFSGTNAIVNSNAPGLLINPSGMKDEDGNAVTSTMYPCKVRFETTGESDFYIGTNKDGYYAFHDGGDETSPKCAASTIDIDKSVIYDNFGYRTEAMTSSSQTFTDLTNITKDYTGFSTFISSAKSTYKFIKFTMTPKTDSRDKTNQWATICFPYSGTVTNGKVYEVFGRIMYADGETRPSTVPEGGLKHLILQAREGDYATKFEAGKAYVVRRLDANQGVTSTMDTPSETNVYTAPVANTGLKGTYTSVKMAVGSYFINGSQVLSVGAGNNWAGSYRAYFPYVSKSDNFLTNVPLVYLDGYKVYKRVEQSGAKVINISDYLILGEEETATLINECMGTTNNAGNLYYDLQGRRIDTPQKGNLYILNGKKVIY